MLYTYLLAPGAWAWAGFPDLDLSYLRLLTFIGVVSAAVRLVEMVLDRTFPALFATFGVFLSLLAVHCAILGGSLFSRPQLQSRREYRFWPWRRHRFCRGGDPAVGNPAATGMRTRRRGFRDWVSPSS